MILLGLICLFSYAAGLAVLAAPECTQLCPGEEADGSCAPLCSNCACCFHPRLAAGATQISAPPKVGVILGGRESRVASPNPSEILHVPKPTSA